jgi:predicted porin
LQYDTSDSLIGAVSQYKRDAYYLQVQQRFGSSSLWGAFGQAKDGHCERVGGAGCVTDGLGAKMWSVGYIYDFSKRTNLYVAYYGVNTRQSSSYGIFPSPGIVAPGADARGIGIGLLHSLLTEVNRWLTHG